MPRRGRGEGASSTEAQGQRPNVFSPTMGVTPSPRADGGYALEIRRAAGERGRRGATPTREPAGKPVPQQGSAAARVARAVEAGKGAPGPREGRPLPVPGRGLWLWRRPGRAGARVGSREPAGRKARSGGRGARTANWVPGSRPGRLGWTRRLPAPEAGQSVTPVAPRRGG